MRMDNVNRSKVFLRRCAPSDKASLLFRSREVGAEASWLVQCSSLSLVNSCELGRRDTQWPISWRARPRTPRGASDCGPITVRGVFGQPTNHDGPAKDTGLGDDLTPFRAVRTTVGTPIRATPRGVACFVLPTSSSSATREPGRW